MIQNFKEKVQSMTAKEIIMVMVEGLRNPVTEIDIHSFGDVRDGICYGCAATNVICKIGNINEEEFLEVKPEGTMLYFGKSEGEREFLDKFENAINSLRRGSICVYNMRAGDIGIATIEDGKYGLPELSNDYTEEQLERYVELANTQA